MLSDVGFCCQIFSFSTQRLLFTPLCGCQECVAGVGGCLEWEGRGIRKNGAQHKG